MCQDVASTPATVASEEAGARTLPVSRGWKGFEALLFLMIKTSSGEAPLSAAQGPTVPGYLAPAKKIHFTKGRTAGL